MRGAYSMDLKHRLAITVTAVALLLPTVAQAGGLSLYEIATSDVGLASAGWTARAQDPATLLKNPAGMSLLEGNQFQAVPSSSKPASVSVPVPAPRCPVTVRQTSLPTTNRATTPSPARSSK